MYSRDLQPIESIEVDGGEELERSDIAFIRAASHLNLGDYWLMHSKTMNIAR